LASNFNNNMLLRGAADDRTAAPVEAVPAEVPVVKAGDGPVTSDRPESAAFVRFRSCRWMQPAENGNQEFCTHREVKPYAGTQGFDADAWCPECAHYKLRRAPKKRNPADDYSY
jgi:hypothetical protein